MESHTNHVCTSLTPDGTTRALNDSPPLLHPSQELYCETWWTYLSVEICKIVRPILYRTKLYEVIGNVSKAKPPRLKSILDGFVGETGSDEDSP